MIVEADETYYGADQREAHLHAPAAGPSPRSGRTGPSNKRAILGLVERGGKVRTFHVVQATKVNVAALVTENIDHESILYTDESRLYHGMKDHFADSR